MAKKTGKAIGGGVEMLREDLLEVLSRLRPGLGGGELVEQYSHFIFVDGMVVAYNDQSAASFPFDVGFTGSVRAEELYRVLEKMGSDTVYLDHDDRHFLVSGGRTRSGLEILTKGEVLERVGTLGLAGLRDREWKRLPGGFVEGVGLCMFSVSRNRTHGWASCVVVSEDGIFSTDDYRVSHFSLKMEDSMLIPLESAVFMVERHPDIGEYLISPDSGWAHFRDAFGMVLSARLLAADVPDMTEAFDVGKGSKLVLPDDLDETLDRVLVLAEGDYVTNRKATLHLEGGRMTFRGEVPGVGWIEESIDVEFPGKKSVEFVINPAFFKQIIGTIPKVTITETRALFEGERFRHVLALFEPKI